MQVKRRIVWCDLDGTLTNSNALFEMLWVLVKNDISSLIIALWVLCTRGRAFFKWAVADAILDGQFELSPLPLNQNVVKFLREEKGKGSKLVLITATDERIARQYADTLALFDEVVGSSQHQNLKGLAKVNHIHSGSLNATHVYLGDSAADLVVWKNVDEAVVVGRMNLQRKLQRDGRSSTYINHQNPWNWLTLIKALRLYQWIKNTLIFFPMVLAHEWSADSSIAAVQAFVLFSLCASGVYLLNDLLDLAADRDHPRKRFRPIASGAFSIELGSVLAILLPVSAVMLGFYFSFLFGVVLLGYFLLTLFYSSVLKQVAYLDVMVLAVLYTSRLVAGSVATDVPLSGWLVAFSLVFFSALAAMKRLGELVDSIARGQQVLVGRGYGISEAGTLRRLVIGLGLAAMVVFTFYAQVESTQRLYPQSVYLAFAGFGIGVWLVWMSLSTVKGNMTDDPIVFALRDPVSWLIAACVILSLYFGGFPA